MPVREPQHRPHRPRQVERKNRAGVEVVAVAAESVFQIATSAERLAGGHRPSVLQRPQVGVGFEAFGNGKYGENGPHDARRRAGRRIASPRIHGEDPVVIAGIHHQPDVGVGIAGCDKCGLGVQRRIVGKRADHDVVRKSRVIARRPIETHRGRLNLGCGRFRHRRGRIAHGNVVQPPPVGRAGGIARHAEPQQQRRSAGKGGQVVAGANPRRRSGREARQGRPRAAGIGRSFDVAEIAGQEIIAMTEHEDRTAPPGEATRGGQGQRHVGIVPVVGAGRIRPAQGASRRRFGGQIPGRVRHPRAPAAFAVVQERKFHARRRAGLNGGGQGFQPVGAFHRDRVIIGRFRRNRDVRHRCRSGIRDLAHQRG